MPADPTAAHSPDRSRHCLTLTTSAQPNGECGRVVVYPGGAAQTFRASARSLTVQKGGSARERAPSRATKGPRHFGPRFGT